ncbi:transposase [Sporosarcina sp. Marseille-Q4943]|uniref:transposase n=1 Tax=Sporosarcina sp. Marseille-Q4943 TaxID=2942204 RepID=UPI00208DDB18|nr:transposase [Sporosarcina sp. Marseille-Q4943]
MARRRRYWNPYGYFHVTMRGNNRQHIFQTDEDKRNLMRAFDYAYDRYPFSIVSYCIMSNHYHLLIQSEVNLSRVMARINRRYSDYYAKRYDHVGRIYEKRYFSKLANGLRAILDISSYIHRNPIDTKIPMVKSLEDYSYSSFQYYADVNKTPPRFLNTELVPTFLPKPFETSTHAYCLYCLVYKQDIEKVYEEMPSEDVSVPVQDTFMTIQQQVYKYNQKPTKV